jgi:hypothetical protein
MLKLNKATTAANLLALAAARAAALPQPASPPALALKPITH